LNRRELLLAGGAAIALSGVAGRALVAAQESTPVATEPLPMVPPELEQYSNEWPTPQGNPANQRAAANSSITAENVTNLEVAWSFPIEASGAYGGMVANPIIANGVVYLQDIANNVFALDLETGEQIWKADINTTVLGPNGVCLGYGMIFGSTGDNREMFALDAATGKEVWRTILSGNTREGIDIAPVVYNGVVYTSTIPGNSRSFYDGGARGTLFALDARDGQILWQFYTTDNDLWGNPSVNSGGGSWYPPAIDADGNLFWDIANPAPFLETEVDGTPVVNGSTREGDNLYSDCLVKLAPDGSLQWYYAANRHDIFDHDLQQSPVLVQIDNNGQPYEVALASGKLGKVIAVETTTGLMVWSTDVGMHTAWDDSQWVPPGDAQTVLPGVQGGVESPIAYADGRVFVPIFNFPTDFANTGLDLSGGINFAESTGQLVALNVIDGSILWDVSQPAGNVSAATVTNDVVFAGALDGIVRAYAAESGDLLWSYQTGAGLNAPFAAAGDYLLVPSAGPRLVPEDYVSEATPAASAESGSALIAFKVSA
jgi:glucose dehydrogenase